MYKNTKLRAETRMKTKSENLENFKTCKNHKAKKQFAKFE